MAAMRLKLEKM